ncbi:MAG: DUF6939 family protein [Paludibacteraceae bacterium]
MIVIVNKRTRVANIQKKYGGDALIIDVTSHAENEYRQLSPFYPHYGIPVPFSEGYTATCVEAVWQGLKVFEGCDVDTTLFENNTMRNMKRTVRRFGRPLGHRKGVHGKELLSYLDARVQIYIPTYRWVLEHKVATLIQRLRELNLLHTIVLLDYDTNEDVYNTKQPLSHAALIKAYVERKFPYNQQNAANEAVLHAKPQTAIQTMINFD